MKTCLRMLAWLLLLAGCERQVTVYGDGVMLTPPFTATPGGTGGMGGTNVAGAAGEGSTSAQGDTGSVATQAGSAGMHEASGGAGGDVPIERPFDLRNFIAEAQPMAISLLDRFEVLTEELQAIERPNVADDGVSLVQPKSAQSLAVLHVDWSGAVALWYGGSGAYAAYGAAYADRHLSLLHAESYGIFANGGDVELSGTPALYKEQLAASAAGTAFIEYAPPFIVAVPGLPATYGTIVLHDWNGARRTLSDDQRYRARLALSATHLAYVEYASVDPPSVGQIAARPLIEVAPRLAAPSALHQDRPALDGDWLVFEEYTSDSDAVIRAVHVVSGEQRTLSNGAGFRTNADVLGTRVVWEDHRSGNGDIYFCDLATGSELPLVTGRGHSAAPRLTSDGVVWIESTDGVTGLMRARWASNR